MPRKKKEPAVVSAPVSGGIIDEEMPAGNPDVVIHDTFHDVLAEKVEQEDDEPQEVDGALVQAAKTGDRRQLLVAMRDRLAYMLETTNSGRDCAAIARNLNIISKELDTIPNPDDAELDPVEAMRQKVKAKQNN